MESWDGFKWFIRRKDDLLVLNDGEECLMRFLKEASGKDKVLLDVGAHVGKYTVRLSRLYGKVIAFEPNPENLKTLRKNLELNKCSNVEVLEFAAGDFEGELELHDMGGSSTFLGVKQKTPVYKVYVKRIDDLVEHADVVKIDAEGWEERVVRGMYRLIERDLPLIVIEHHEARGYKNLGDMKGRIRRLLSGYYAFDVNGIHSVYIPKNFGKEEIAERFPSVIVCCWIKRVFDNVKAGRDWYYGLPYTWWYGAGVSDFALALPRHVKNYREEPDWVEKMIS